MPILFALPSRPIAIIVGFAGRGGLSGVLGGVTRWSAKIGWVYR